MSSAISIGTTGLTASSKQMDVIGNNLANANTLGFKAGNTYFASMLNQSLTGGSSGSMQVGQGVTVAAVSTQFAQGSFETTGNATDLAIDGDGFFILRDEEGAVYYTRAGSFHINEEGYLVDLNAYKVQGYNLFSSDTDEMSDISLKNVQSAPKASTEIAFGLNLNDSDVAGEVFNASQSVFDSKGEVHSLTSRFMKTEASGMWGLDVRLDDSLYSTGQIASGFKFDSNGALTKMYTADIGTPTVTTAGDGTATATVNHLGQMYKDTTSAITLTRGANATTWTLTDKGGYTNAIIYAANADEVSVDLDGVGGADVTFELDLTWAAGDTIAFSINETEIDTTNITLTFGALTNGATIGDTSSGSNQILWNLTDTTANRITGYASSSVIKSLSDNGYSSGVLKSLSMKDDGIISGFFTNGQTATLGQIILADFPNSSGLQKVGNYFGQTVASGEAIKNEPGSGGLGSIMSNTLEVSNTDVAKEFINMITAQRAYQASSRVITTADQMLTELMNIKR